MNERYSDTSNVVESLRTHTDESDEDEGRITVLDAGQAVVVAEDDDAMQERNLWSAIDRIDDAICTIHWEVTHFGTTQLELTFHENSVTETLEFKPAGVNAIAPTQATQPTELSDALNEALSDLQDELDAHFSFKEVSAASIAQGGHYTSFEYKYSIDTMENL